MAANSREYQNEAAFFRSLGLDAVSDVRVQGVRTAHDIDLLVKTRLAGFEVTDGLLASPMTVDLPVHDAPLPVEGCASNDG